MTKKTPKKTVELVKKSRVTWNDKVAKSRNKNKWKKRIMEGKSEVPMHPTLLRQRRVQNGDSQADLAAKLGLTTTTFGDMERGKRPVKKEVAEKIAQLIGSSVHFLFNEHEKSKNKVVAKKVA